MMSLITILWAVFRLAPIEKKKGMIESGEVDNRGISPCNNYGRVRIIFTFSHLKHYT